MLLHEGGFPADPTRVQRAARGISGPIVDIAHGPRPEIDLVVSGHTHQPYVCNIPTRPASRGWSPARRRSAGWSPTSS